MIIAAYAVAGILMAAGSLYFAWRSIDFRKFLAGAFFVSSGILAYLAVSAARAVVHFALFLICLYSGFFRGGRTRAGFARLQSIHPEIGFRGRCSFDCATPEALQCLSARITRPTKPGSPPSAWSSRRTSATSIAG